MSGSIAQLERSSAGAVGDPVISCLLKGESDQYSMYSAAAAAYPELENALESYRENVANKIVTCASGWDQWELPDENPNANADLLFFKRSMVISVAAAVERLFQPFPLNDFTCWGVTPSSNISGRWLDWSLGSSACWHEYANVLLYHVCSVDVKVWSFISQSDPIEDLYQIEDSRAVAEFLAQNEFLHDLLVEAHGKIVEFFGEGADVHLEVCDDQDSGRDRQLYAVIVTSLPAKDVIPIQERFDDEWWLDSLMKARGKFNIIVEYV